MSFGTTLGWGGNKCMAMRRVTERESAHIRTGSDSAKPQKAELRTYCRFLARTIMTTVAYMVSKRSLLPETVITATYIICSCSDRQIGKTFNSQDSLVVTHPTTNWPLDSFSVMSGRGSEFSELGWSNVWGLRLLDNIIPCLSPGRTCDWLLNFGSYFDIRF